MSRAIRRVVSYYARPKSFATGGVNASSQEWMRAFAQQGIEVKIVYAQGGYDQRLVSDSNLRYAGLRHFGKSRMTMIPMGLGEQIDRADLVYLHEGWTPSNAIAAAICRLKSVPYVVMPHGVYDRRIAKRQALYGLRRRVEGAVLRGALAVHLFFDSERTDVLAINSRARTFTAMTGMDLPDSRWKPRPGRGYIAWLARFDIQHKGIDLLLHAMARIPAGARPMLRMCGPDHRGDKVRVEAMVAEKGLSGSVSVEGELRGNDVQKFLLASDAFIHTPRWESFGQAVAEAAALGVPMVLSESANITSRLSAAQAAVAVKPDCSDLDEALSYLFLHASSMSAAALKWSQDNLDWSNAAQRALVGLGAARDS